MWRDSLRRCGHGRPLEEGMGGRVGGWGAFQLQRAAVQRPCGRHGLRAFEEQKEAQCDRGGGEGGTDISSPNRGYLFLS